MKHLRGIVESPTVPNTTDVLWLDADGGLKAFKNGEWKALVEKGSGGNSGGNNDNELIIHLDTDNSTIKINDFVYNYTNGDKGPHLINSTDLFNYISNNNIKHATLILYGGGLILTCNSTTYMEGVIDDIDGMGFQFYDGSSISIIIQNKD